VDAPSCTTWRALSAARADAMLAGTLEESAMPFRSRRWTILACALATAFAPAITAPAGAAPLETPPLLSPQQKPQTQRHPDLPLVDEFVMKSECVSAFAKKERVIEAGVVRPLDWKEGDKLPVAYNVHGFGGNHLVAWEPYGGPMLQAQMKSGEAPRMIYVFLNAQFEWGHHEFADSRCNGPWGQALTTEFIPALEKKFGAIGQPWARFLTGHSSGGWSTLWLQVNYPDFFGGCWSTAPDSVDFRDFTGIDVYHYDNAFVDPQGEPIMLVRSHGKFVASIKDYVTEERQSEPVGGQFFSFNAVFSEMGKDGMPKQIFDWKTGAIDHDVADSWEKYDIALILRENWKKLEPKLAGKVHVYVGTIDTYRLEGALKLLKEDLAKLKADSEVQILFVEGRDHGTLYAPHPQLWPKGMMERIHREMFETYTKNAAAQKKH
jgi:S-formylglutathione hydrolase FrmB